MPNESNSRRDAENIVKDELKNKLLSGEEIKIEDMIKRVDNQLQKNNETVQKVMKGSLVSRGSVIETAIHLEDILNQILLQYYNPNNHEHFRKDFLFRTLSLSQKKDIINTIIKREKLIENKGISSEFGRKFKELIEIRNIYAHYPEDVFNESGFIEVSHQEFKSMKELNQTFMNLAKELFGDLHKMSVFILGEVIKNGQTKTEEIK